MGNRASLCHCINCWYCVQKGVETGKRVDPKYGVAHMKVWTERSVEVWPAWQKQIRNVFFTVFHNTDHMI